MAILGTRLDLDRCPHCAVHRPSLSQQWKGETKDYLSSSRRFWGAYACNHCGGLVIAGSRQDAGLVEEIYPKPPVVDDDIPRKAHLYLVQAVASVHAPAGAVMLAASAVDAMLKEKGYLDGSLYARINLAKEKGLITADMAEWAHEVRLDANDQRHADHNAELPTEADARQSLDFVQALGMILFVLPKRVERGRKAASEPTTGA